MWSARPPRRCWPGWPLGQGERPQTFPVEGPHGELWLSITAAEFPQGTVYAFRDLTEERAVEQLKSDFVSTVSHELRTPLAAIYGAAMTLQRDDVELNDAQEAGMLDVISGESERLARIVNDILLASRLDSGAATVEITRTDAAELARGVLAAAEAHVPPGVELALTVPEPGPQVAADPDGLRQVLVNLVENAVKYSPNGGLVELELEPTDGRVRFVVRDRGLGIPASEHERIFEKFFRLDPNLTRGVGGTGLGLYISREIVRRMGGRICVESRAGQRLDVLVRAAAGLEGDCLSDSPGREAAPSAVVRDVGSARADPTSSTATRGAGLPRRRSSCAASAGDAAPRRPEDHREHEAEGADDHAG